MSDSDPNASSKIDEKSKSGRPTCSCGFDRHHHFVSQERTYTPWGNFCVVLMGVSANPIRIDFRCRRCKEKFEFITNPQELRRYL